MKHTGHFLGGWHEPAQTEEPPKKFTPNNVCFWEETSRSLKTDKKNGAILSKAKAFILAGCIERKSETEWICKNLKGYNKATHFINSTEDDFECSCQGFNVKKKEFEDGKSDIKPFCSHIVAVKQFCFLEERQ